MNTLLTRAALLGVAAGTLTLVAPQAQADFRVRAIHASPDAGTVDVLNNGGLFIEDFAYNTSSGYVTVPNASYDIDLVPADQASPVFDLFGPQNLADAGDVTIVAADRVGSLTPIVLNDDNTIDPLNARLRVVHASPDAGNVSVLSGSIEVVPSLDFLNPSGYLTLPAGTYDELDVRLNDASGTPLVDLPVLELRAGFVYTVFATGLVNPDQGEEGFGVLVTTDIPAPGAAMALGIGGLALTRRRRAA